MNNNQHITPPQKNDTCQPRRRRIEWVDVAKCVGILMVMYGHNWLDWKYAYLFNAFHMPLFFILSGYTFSVKGNLRDFVLRKAKALLVPYCTFACIYILFYWSLSVTHDGGFSPGKEVVLFLFQRSHTFLWFLPTLFLSEITVRLLLSSGFITGFKSKLATFAILILMAWGLAFMKTNAWIWNIDLVPIASAFVMTGILYRQYFESKLPEKSVLFLTMLLISAIIISTFNYVVYSNVDMASRLYGMFPLFLAGALLLSYALIMILKRVHYPNWMLYIGMNTIIYYGFHRFIIELCFIAYGKMGIVFDATSLLWVALAVLNVIITCVALYPVSVVINKKCPWLIGKF